jgi:hypothetical protein
LERYRKELVSKSSSFVGLRHQFLWLDVIAVAWQTHRPDTNLIGPVVALELDRKYRHLARNEIVIQLTDQVQ